jgi:hypothetical protein
VTFTVQASGPIERVEVYLYNPNSTHMAPITIPLSQSNSVWMAIISAPATPGLYHFTVALYDQSGHRIVKDANNWNLTVTAPPTTTPVTLPADIVLAPPFNWGSPSATMFDTLGQTIEGYKVVSDIRSNVDPTAVYDFYNNHLPRAGWTVEAGATTAPTANGFGLTATKHNGTRVVVVLMARASAGYQVTVEYGTAPSSG